MEIITGFEKDGWKLVVRPDDESPRSRDNLGVMFCMHRRYALGDEHPYTSGDFNGWEEVEDWIWKEKDPVVVLPLYMYDHGNIRIRTYPFDCPWDSGQLGYIYAPRKKVLEEQGRKRMSEKLKKTVENILAAEVTVYDRYVSGRLCIAEVKDPAGELVDICGYKDVDDALEELSGEYGWIMEP